MKIDGKEWKLVPVERTTDMHDAQHLAYGEPCDHVWRAQIDAAPSPDIEALVEGVAKAYMRAAHEVKPVDLGGLDLDQVINDAWADMTADKSGVEHIARAVLRHLFGEG